MDKNKIIMQFVNHRTGQEADIEVPVDITANDLIVGLNDAFQLGMDVDNLYQCCLSTENPIALVKGNRKLADFGLRNGTVINMT